MQEQRQAPGRTQSASGYALWGWPGLALTSDELGPLADRVILVDAQDCKNFLHIVQGAAVLHETICRNATHEGGSIGRPEFNKSLDRDRAADRTLVIPDDAAAHSHRLVDPFLLETVR